MSEMQAPTAIDRIKNLSEATRNTIALGIWLVVLVGLLFVTVHGQSKLMTAGLFLQFTGAYSTFLLCGRSKYSPLVHGVPYTFVFTGAVLLCLAPDFPAPVAASLVFLAVTALMHSSVISGMRKVLLSTENTSLVGECLS